MESFLPLSGFQLPFQQRLSRLYNDTKKSSDFVKEPVQNEEDPEVKALHRKLRIQKDRLVTWGLEWSDPTQSAEIDESLSKAGLSEVVGSIMSTIKDILAEAEPLWLSSKHLAEGNRPAPDRKLVPWDKTRFEDLVRDLTSSIDTLYDLSRTRSIGAVPRRPSKTIPYKAPASVDDFRPFESTRMQTPQLIRPDSLTHLRPKQGNDGVQLREVVFMSKTAYAELNLGATREPWAPLLLEYAPFDSIYSVTGIMPPMSRFEKLSAGLQQEPQRSPGVWTGLPRLIGYFEDMDNSRFGLVYRFPPSFNAVSFEPLTQNPHYNLPTLGDLLAKPDAEPPLEAKFRLAHNLTNTIFDMHTRGITHGNLTASNISFCDTVNSGPTVTSGDVDVRRPLVSSFDVFPEDTPSASLSRHPLDPRASNSSSLSKSTDDRVLELYSLAMILLSIGMWCPLENLTSDDLPGCVSETLLDRLAQKCGSLYMKATHACWSAVENERRGECTGEALLSAVQMRATRFLETCCILDGVSGLEERLTQELKAPEQPPPRKQSIPPQQPSESSSKGGRDVKSPSAFPTPVPQDDLPPELIPRTDVDFPASADVEADGNNHPYRRALCQPRTDRVSDVTERPGPRSEGKVKLYPSVPLPPDAVEKWNTILMPQINHALRHFYRKHPESVEISLESVGPSPANTKPTVLVVCSSVGKVRAILKKRLGELFDDSTGFALKVCRGHVLRSRRWSKDVIRSMARKSHVGDNAPGDDDNSDVEAVNPEFQERPGNGASIGAWIGDRHLPPVSFGGLVLVDDRVYGMTVHHMLDDPDRDFGNGETARSSAVPGREWFAHSVAPSSVDEDEFAYDLSDTESEAYSESDITSDWGDDEEEEDEFEPGDIPGIEPGCGDGYVVTQPALDDVEEGFYPSPETEDEDHLDTFTLGEVYASSGIRRKMSGGLIHEVDWALFEFTHDRLPGDNSIPVAQANAGKKRSKSRKQDGQPSLRPTAVTPSSSLPGLEVQCMARTSGLQTGRILPALTSVKIYGRTSPSHTYQIASTHAMSDNAGAENAAAPIGIPGDSGAWIVDRENGQLCGHVLAWSQRKQVAYICPMDVMLMDIAQSLEASEIRLPGGEVVVTLGEHDRGCTGSAVSDGDTISKQIDYGAAHDGQAAPKLAASLCATNSASSHSLHSMVNIADCDGNSGSPIQIASPDSIGVLNRSMDDLRVDRGIGVGV